MNNLKFLFEKRYKKARAGKIFSHHGVIETPVFMPVGTLGSVKATYPEDLNLNIQIILANTYHLMQRPGDSSHKRNGRITKVYFLEQAYTYRFINFKFGHFQNLKK